MSVGNLLKAMEDDPQQHSKDMEQQHKEKHEPQQQSKLEEQQHKEMHEPQQQSKPEEQQHKDMHEPQQQSKLEEQQHKDAEQKPQQIKELLAITTLELQSHCTAHDLWVSIYGKVYDVTSWLPFHPGGEMVLLSLAGQDVTDTFIAFHPPNAFLCLPQYLVGTLIDYQIPPTSSDYRRTVSELRKAGMFRKNRLTYIRLAFSIFALLALCFAGVFLSKSFLVHMGSAFVLGFMWTQTGFFVHDFAHSSLLGNPKIDMCIEVLAANCLTGLSLSWWKTTHNAHHVSTNNVNYDPDLQYIPIFAVSTKFFSSVYSHFHERKMDFDGLARLLVSYQHWTFYPVMLIARIFMVAQAFAFFLSKKKIRNRGLEIAGIFCFWAWLLTLLANLPNAFERIAFILVSFGTPSIQHLQFCLNHFASEVMEDRPDGKAFMQSQVRGTLDISCPSWMDWFHGGLQFQVEHHLFPHLPRHNLRKVSSLVKALCDKHGLPYISVGFLEANVMVIRTLRTAAMQARDLTKPVPKNLVWEAVNALG